VPSQTKNAGATLHHLPFISNSHAKEILLGAWRNYSIKDKPQDSDFFELKPLE
jgi:hypothetical protein